MTVTDRISVALNRRVTDRLELRDLDVKARDEIQRLTNDRTVLTAILRR